MPAARSLEAALKRLEQALGQLDTAVDQRVETVQRRLELEDELHEIGRDRSRLAQSLDAAEARGARLEQANRDVSRRLVAAMESIRAVLERSGS
jgi:FtsZ-binding cell division protein ZapB